VLITHFFSGTSHAFGKYTAEDKAAGYWDAIIGPGKAIDTNKYFVLSSDTLANLNVNMPNVVTTGPASIDPDTGKPYGMSFPVVSIKDFARVEKALIDSLGIKKLKAVVGASMGGLQAYEWAQSYPDGVERIVAVVACAAPEPYLIAWLDMWAQPIRLDPKWNNGDYYGKAPPLEGLKAALKLVTLLANSWEWARTTFGTAPAEAGCALATSVVCERGGSLLPTIRAEFGMAYNYEHQPVQPFSFPISSFVGDLDPWVSEEDSAAWGELTRGRFANHVHKGSHFLMAEDREYILATINDEFVNLANE
jgi:homoserine O-acetyltransferase